MLRSLIALSAMVASSQAVLAGVLYEDFADTTLDPLLAVSPAPAGYSLVISGGVATFSKGADLPDKSMNIATTVALSGDFVVTGRFSRTNLTGATALGLMAWSGSNFGDVYFQADLYVMSTIGWGGFTYGYDYTTARDVTFKMERSGNTLSFFCDANDGSGWVSVQSRSSAAYTDPVYVGAFFAQQDGLKGANSGTLDDLTIVNSAVPEPGTMALLLIGAQVILVRRKRSPSGSGQI